MDLLAKRAGYGCSKGELSIYYLSIENIFNPWIAQYILLTLIHWIAIYPLARAISPLNNWAQYSIWKLAGKNEIP